MPDELFETLDQLIALEKLFFDFAEDLVDVIDQVFNLGNDNHLGKKL